MRAQTAPKLPEKPTALPQSGQPDNPGFTLSRSVNEVNLIFTVTDKQGRFIRNLQQQNFGLLDDRKPPSEVYSFTQQTDLPLRVGLMLDTSSSIRSRFQFEQNAAKEFLLQVLRPGKDKAFVEGFDNVIDLTQNYTDNIDLLNTGISKLRPGGGTALYDSIYKTCRDQLLPMRSRQSVRRALILVSDGDDDFSHAQLIDAIQMCQRAETIIYAISTNIGPSKDRGDDVLKKLTEATGGRAFFPTQMEDIAIHFHNIEEELRSQYSLAYKPADFKADGSFRTIYLVAMDPRYKVRVSKGYYATQ
ncbi:MAG: VWA domain-containing protein [Acidobacteriaceae bacterium]